MKIYTIKKPVKYYHYRAKKYPSDLDVWTKAQELEQKDFRKWLFDEVNGK